MIVLCCVERVMTGREIENLVFATAAPSLLARKSRYNFKRKDLAYLASSPIGSQETIFSGCGIP